jgi:hypothetical protein
MDLGRPPTFSLGDGITHARIPGFLLGFDSQALFFLAEVSQYEQKAVALLVFVVFHCTDRWPPMFAFFMLCVAVEISSTAFGNRVDPVFPNLSPIAFITRDVIIL